MHRLRERWVALLGGALLVTLSVSTAFGADPEEDTEGGPRGQTIAGFVHSLIFTEDEPTDGDELVEDETLDDEGERDEADAELVEGERADGSAHGACVSDVARDPDAIGGDNENHGGAVSEAARVTCWEPVEEDAAAAVDEVGDAEELSAKEQRKADQAAARAERKAEREAARAEAKAERDAAHEMARTERAAARAERKAARGNGH